jgi:catechol 2,3-dioxygenase-like lactoylglutathione lyase family enzyme
MTDSPLARGHVATRLPAQDLDRARAWYRDKLGLEPAEEREGGLRYRCGDTYFALFTSAGAAAGTHTQMGWTVDDIEATVAWLRARGVEFEEYDVPGLRTVGGIADVAGNYPSLGTVSVDRTGHGPVSPGRTPAGPRPGRRRGRRASRRAGSGGCRAGGRRPRSPPSR